jgi:hypothetical protein
VTSTVRLSTLRAIAERSHQEYEAMMMLAFHVTREAEKQLTSNRTSIARADESQLRRAIEDLRREKGELRRKFGIVAGEQELLDLLAFVKNSPAGELSYIAKYYLKQMVSGYQKMIPNFELIPDHARIGLTTRNEPRKPGALEFRILEATMFEDMCSLFNLAHENRIQSNIDNLEKSTFKRSLALNRATIVAAFFFVESYLNGLAADHLLRHENSLTQDDETVLLEWDARSGRPRGLGLVDKVQKYLRIILGTQHSPIQPSNSPELKFMAESIENLRDPIVHASPLNSPKIPALSREERIFSVRFSDVEKVVDTAIVLVRNIEKTVHGDLERVWWLNERGADGVFPQSVFD